MVDTTPSTPDDESSAPNDASASSDGASLPSEASGAPVSKEITLRDGESVTFSAPADGTAHIVVNVVQPPQSTGFFSSCLQGCGCLVLVIVILSAIGSFVR